MVKCVIWSARYSPVRCEDIRFEFQSLQKFLNAFSAYGVKHVVELLLI